MIDTMSQRSKKNQTIRKQREEQRAEKIVKGVFIGLIILAIISVICFSIWG